MRFGRLFSLVLLTFAILSCGTADKTYTVKMIDGVRHVHNLAPALAGEPKIRLEFVRKIGGEEETDENYIFFKPRGITIDNDGNIYVLDSGNYLVKKFDSDWNFITSFGREGQGPGEFGRMSAPIDISSMGEIYVFNTLDNRMQIFEQNGEIVKGVNFIPAGGFVTSKILENDDIALIRTPDFADYEKSTGQSLICVMDQDGTVLHEFGEFEHYGDPLLKAYANRAMIDKGPDNTIIVNFLCHNRIDRYSTEGQLLSRFDRPLNYSVENDLKRDMRDGRERAEPDLTIVSFVVAVDGKGRTWVDTAKEKLRVPDRKAERMFHVFDRDGVLLQELQVPVTFSFCYIFGETMYLLEEQGVSISEYRIITTE